MFLTVEPYEVRCEVLASIESLAEHLDLPLGARDTISIQDQVDLKVRALTFLEQGTQLHINDSKGIRDHNMEL